MIEPAYNAEEAHDVWVYLEQESGRLERVSLELLGKGRELAYARGTALVGVLLGHKVSELAREAISRGADEVLLADDPLLEVYATDAHTKVVYELATERKPEILLLGATPNGRDLAGRLGVRLRTGLIADCTDLMLEENTGLLIGEVAGFGGGVLALIKCAHHRPQTATVRPGIFQALEPRLDRDGKITVVPVNLSPSDIRTEVLERVMAQEADITGAKVVIAGGRGVGGDFSLLQELAELMGGEVGATRVAVDEGWIGRERQIGQTGYVTRPKLAIACGTSGAFQFTVGIEAADAVVAINTDREAPIFESADYCVVDDLFKVLPPLISRIKRARGMNGSV